MKTLRNLALAATLAVSAITASTAAQAAELLVNGSFETPVLGDGYYTYPGQPWGNYPGGLASPTQDGWTYGGSALGGGGPSNPWYGNSPPSGVDGAQFVALQGTSTLAQTFTMLGSILDVSWLSAGRPNFGCCNGDQNYQVTITGAGPTLTSQTYFTTSGQNFVTETAHFTGLQSGQQYTLTFQGLDTYVGGDQTSFIDKVSAVGVPEASTWALMLVGFGGLGGMLRLQRRQRMSALA